MTDVVRVALIASAPATVVAVATLITAVRGLRKVDAVHQAVNGNLAAVKAELALAVETIEALRKELRRITL